MIHKNTCDQCAAGHSHIAKYSVEGKGHTRNLTPLHDQCDTDRVLYGCKETNDK